MKQIDINRYVPFLFLLVLLASAATFWPALTGPFLLDDFLHFPKLGENGSVNTLSKALALAFASTSGSHRPLSFLSLLINDNSWPTAPWSFKYTNLMIHLLNGVLVFIFCRSLLTLFYRNSGEEKKTTINLTSLIVMAIWLIHPVQLSPMMLTIQRMTLLMATFSLLALIFYLKGRRISLENTVKGYWVMSLALGIFVPLGILCKEPAIMTVCYIIVIETTLFASIQLKKPPHWRYWYAVFILLPLGLVIAYFFYKYPQMQQYYARHDWNMYERLLSESRALVEYLRIILFPSLSASGPYHDDFIVSRGILSPVTTLFSILLIFSLLFFSIFYRRKHPLASFAILWFFLAHTLESTILPLELYFEHRNYLPMLGFFISFVIWVQNTPINVRKFSYIGLILFFVLETGISYSSAKVWGSKLLISTVWAHDHPASIRAQLDAVQYWISKRKINLAKKYLEVAFKAHPGDASLRLYEFYYDRCSPPSARKLGGSMDTLQNIIPTAVFENASLPIIRDLIKGTKKGKKYSCRITNDELSNIIELYLNNPRFRKYKNSRAVLFELKSEMYIRTGDLDGSIKALDKAYKAFPNYQYPLNQAYLLATAGLFDNAYHYLDIAKNTKPINFGIRLFQNQDISRIEITIKKIQKYWKDNHVQ